MSKEPCLLTAPAQLDLQQQMLQIHADGLSWRAVGTQTRMQPQTAADVFLSAAALKQIHWIDAEDRTCEVDAGLSPAALHAGLDEYGLMLSHSGCSDDVGTIGGLLNSGTPSLLAGSCGLPRDQVLGATWLLGDGRVIRSGARVVKSVAGYDVSRLLLSAQGQLAVGLRFILRLRPRPSNLRWYQLPTDLQRPPSSWRPWADFQQDGRRFAAWESCDSPLPQAQSISSHEGDTAWKLARKQCQLAKHWLATPGPWPAEKMHAAGLSMQQCLILDHLAHQSAWPQLAEDVALPAGSAVLPHRQASPWLDAMRQALLRS
ncbi:MAG: FAD-binding oxidoreductase [Planctomycetes bacterium]|nr:FAD-binding oxidoreductase [Planctomycetota bacterium]